MKDKFYMKDVMAKFHVGRDTIKYYEKQGIIHGYRDSNGYRYYDYLALKRMERVFWLHNMGFSIEQIKRFLTGLSIEEELQLNVERITELEMQIVSLKAQLEFAKEMYTYHKGIPECYKKFQICDAFEVCLRCEKEVTAGDRWMMRRDMKILYLKDDFSVEREEYYENVAAQHTMRLNEACHHCCPEMIVRTKAVRGVLKATEMYRFQEFLTEIEEDIRSEYIMDRRAYCLDGYYIEAEPREEGVAIEFYVPITRREDSL